MDNNYRSTNIDTLDFTTATKENKLLRNSFAWMALAMVLTSTSALLFAFVPELTSLLMSANEEGILKPTFLAYAVMFAPLLFILGINFGLNRLSFPALIGLFVAYSLVNGISFSLIFMVYKIGSILNVFLSTSALFAVMAIAGYTTKTDLTKMGSLLMIGVIGIVIASLINMFLQSPGFDYLISILGVIIFTGLTAYDVQKIKNLGYEMGGSNSAKLGLIGALTLYLDFVNLFMFLLNLFGDKKD